MELAVTYLKLLVTYLKLAVTQAVSHSNLSFCY